MREYLEQQLSQVQQTMGTSQESLRQFNMARGGVKVPARNAETVGRLSQIENALAEVQANRNIAQSRYQAMKAKLDAMPAPAPQVRQAAAPAPVASARVQRTRARLAALEGQLLDFQSQYTDEHPRVQSVKRQIADLQAELGDAVKETSTPVTAAATTTAVPAADRAAFAETVAALETSIHSLGAQEEALRNQATALRRDLNGLSKDELEFTRLSTEAESSRKLNDVITEKLRGIKLREQGEMKVVKVIDPPSFPVPAMNAKRLKFIAVAIGAAFLIGLALPTAVEYFNRPVEGEEDIRELLGVPVLAAVPRLNSGRAMFMLGTTGDDAKQEDYFLFTEAFRRLRVELQLLGREMPLRRVLVASSLPGEGKSTVVVNLGLAFGEVGKNVILADADFHRPTLHRTLKAPNNKGFSDLLAGAGELSESMTPVAEGVWVSPRGASPTALSRTGLGSRRLGEVLDRMAEEAEYVLIDSSPILLIPDNLHMAAAVDGVVLVVHSGTTRPRDLLRTKELFDKTATPILGVVLNQVPLKRMSQYYAYYKHYRSYVSGDSKA
jgi:capsular exopolysaccharide synthesis family protein